MRLSVVVPSSHEAPTLDRCLAAIRSSMSSGDELIVVDTASGGAPARRRNDGALRATGDVLVFVNADVIPHPTALDRVPTAFVDEPRLDAVFGCYDDSPAGPGRVSTFRNLLHHHVHMESDGRACTFWSGLGAVRRETFMSVGGFDADQLMMEDIEFGLRIADAGGRIELHQDILGTHLKEWTFSTMLKTDLFDRGIPWTQLMLERRQAPATLNLAWRHRVSALAFLAMAVTPAAAPRPGNRRALRTVGALFGLNVALNHRFYLLLFRRGGPSLGMTGVLLHGAHHLAGVTSVPMALAVHFRATPGPERLTNYRAPPARSRTHLGGVPMSSGEQVAPAGEACSVAIEGTALR